MSTVCSYPGCDRHLVSETRWSALPAEERRRLQREGFYRYASRGLCSRCRDRARVNGTLHDYERRTVAADELLEEWAHLSIDRTLSRRRQIEFAAPRLGMTFEALEKALDRASKARRESAA